MSDKMNFKKELFNACKEWSIALIAIFIFLAFYYSIMRLWLWLISNLTVKYPERKTDIEWLGLAGFGYVVISFFIYMNKTMERLSKKIRQT